VTRLIDGRVTLSADQVRGRLLEEVRAGREHGVQYWPVFLLQTQGHVGCCGLRSHDEEGGILEIGVHIRSEQWSQGYATEATRAVIAYAFNVLGAKALFAGHNPGNRASHALLVKLGFTYTHDEFYEPTGLHHPSYLLTAADYTSGKSVAA
jgi:ribosomal-protein-alanine N-acetyltransferase